MAKRKIERDELPEKFASAEAACEFWDTHDTTEYLDQLVDVDDDGRPLGHSKLEIELSDELIRLLGERAKATGQTIGRVIEDLLRAQLDPAA